MSPTWAATASEFRGHLHVPLLSTLAQGRGDGDTERFVPVSEGCGGWAVTHLPRHPYYLLSLLGQ